MVYFIAILLALAHVAHVANADYTYIKQVDIDLSPGESSDDLGQGEGRLACVPGDQLNTMIVNVWARHSCLFGLCNESVEMILDSGGMTVSSGKMHVTKGKATGFSPSSSFPGRCFFVSVKCKNKVNKCQLTVKGRFGTAPAPTPPTSRPTRRPTSRPTKFVPPTPFPTFAPTDSSAPTSTPTSAPTQASFSTKLGCSIMMVVAILVAV